MSAWMLTYGTFQQFCDLLGEVVEANTTVTDFFLQLSLEDPLSYSAFCGGIALSIVIAYCFFTDKSGVNTARQHDLDDSDMTIFDLAKTSYEENNADIVINLVKKMDFEVNSTSPETGLNLLLSACLSGNVKLIKFILQQGGNIRMTTHDGDTALYLAVFSISNSSSSFEVIDVLIQEGCDVNAVNFLGYTVLHQAASKGNTNLIRKLLDYGANPKIATNAGIYPVNLASTAGFMEAASLLDISDEVAEDENIAKTPMKVKFGLLSPEKHLLVKSSLPKRKENAILGHLDANI
ncbi:poly [ADP-ribose] polymerase tankyrase-1-like isoform X2 [Anneissia japonica]|nr:poly [ADP-ribose] polymerase tankyrase-1-like isoform X2 [Anneissia japonica]